jgi:hypothetical protein
MWQVHPPQKVGEARIAPQRLELRLIADCYKLTIPGFEVFLQPCEASSLLPSPQYTWVPL